jgi:xylan 1,4-beta-xylosidase
MNQNPILPGFHPDPSIVRVGEDYYIASSTFEWFPGVRLHHSRDLVNWTPVGHALTRRSQLDLHGVTSSGGVWAPCLSYDNGAFYLIYSIMRTWTQSPYKDVHNYLVTAPDISGPWSEPVYLHSCGFDPSLFHDTDGRKWLVSMQWDPRPNHPRFAGILLQEYSEKEKQLLGNPRFIMQKKRLIEGPHLYRIGDYYYLLLAEGGTSWSHACTLARSKQIEGPYETDPMGDFLTTGHDSSYPIQKCGHGDLVQTPDGDWYIAFLCSRPVGLNRRCTLGRETGMAPCHWTDDGWLRLSNPEAPCPPVTFTTTLTQGDTEIAPPAFSFLNNPHLQTLRVPTDPSWYDTTSRPGWLRLRGRESPSSLFDQSLVAQRWTHHRMRAETMLEFEPNHFSQMAGLMAWYDTSTYYFLHITHHETHGKTLALAWGPDVEFTYEEVLAPLPSGQPVYLAYEVDKDALQFLYRISDGAWTRIGPALDATVLSDDFGKKLHFTGAFAALAAYDLHTQRAAADFKYLTVTSKENA